MADALDPIRQALAEAVPTREPGPWRLSCERAVGGLLAVGFDRTSETLLVVSANGQSVLDCRTGEMLYRNRDADGYDPSSLKAVRLDRPEMPAFDLAGIDGGGSRSTTDDGWHVERLTTDWPQTSYILQPPGASIFFLKPGLQEYGKDGSFFLMQREAEGRAFGFSWSGRSLVWASASDLMIWHRDMP